MADPTVNGISQIIRLPTPQSKVALPDYADNNIVRLSKRQKQLMAHRGAVEVAQTWDSTPKYELVEEGSSSGYQYVEGDSRPSLAIASTDDGVVMTENGTFDDSNLFEGNASSSSSNDGLVGPLSAALAADNENKPILDLPGRPNGAPIDSENLNYIPGHRVDVSDSFQGLLDTIIGYNENSSATAMTIAQLQTLGINQLVSANLAAYKSALVALDEVTGIGDIQQMVVDVNASA